MQIIELLEYEPETGYLKWKIGRSGVSKGTIAGCITKKGYIHVKVNRIAYGAHRLAWYLHYGKWPSGLLDHINRIKTDNRITNLREVSPTENAFNSKLYSKGHRNISWDKNLNKWRVAAKIQGFSSFFGYYDSLEEAVTARNKYLGDLDV